MLPRPSDAVAATVVGSTHFGTLGSALALDCLSRASFTLLQIPEFENLSAGSGARILCRLSVYLLRHRYQVNQLLRDF